jgi:hypothetical protein
MPHEDAADLAERLAKELRQIQSGSRLYQVLQRWKDFDFIVKENGKWLLEGFVNWFHKNYEILRAVDPTFPPSLPPQCFDMESITAFFRLPGDAFASYRQKRRGVRVRACGPPRPPGRPRRFEWIADFLQRQLDRDFTLREACERFRRSYPEENGDDDRLRKILRRYRC